MDSSRYMSLNHEFLPSSKIFSVAGLASVLGFAAAFYVGYSLILGIYRIYFSPLHYIPGPKLWIAFPLFYHISCVSGRLDSDCRRFFAYYNSPVIRVNHNEVLFSNPQAWQDIYGHGHTPQLPKVMRPPTNETPNIINSVDADHTRFRRSLAHAFSDKALREQEGLIQAYISLFIERLSGLADQGKSVDMTAWYNYLTFDIIGDLSFGEPFGCLKTSSYHWWVSSFIKGLEFIYLRRMMIQFPLFSLFWNLVVSRLGELKNVRADLFKYSDTLVTKRLDEGSVEGRKDFIEFLERHKGESGEINKDEMVSNMFILIAAGSETTASLMTGLTYWLLRTPDVLQKLTKEIRSTFQSEDEITIQAVNSKLPYTVACLQEGLRLYPPVPSSLGRYTLQDEVISGYAIPKHTAVGVHHLGSYWSENNFHRAAEYIPERWLPDALNDPKNEFYHDNRRVVEPFHIGPRNCLGRNLAIAEMRIILSRMLFNFDLEFDPSMLKPRADNKGRSLVETWATDQRSALIWIKPELLVKLTRRKQ